MPGACFRGRSPRSEGCPTASYEHGRKKMFMFLPWDSRAGLGGETLVHRKAIEASFMRSKTVAVPPAAQEN